MLHTSNAMYSIAASALLAGASAAFSSAFAASPACRAESGAGVTPVIELYTSEGCSSCPPADQWLSTLKTPAEAGAPWSAYWSVTEHGHSSKVKAGENAGEFLQHDFVVRQYVPVGAYRGPQTLKFNAIPGQSAHARQVNLVVYDGKTGKTLQALSLACES